MIQDIKRFISRQLKPYWDWRWAQDRRRLLRALPHGTVGAEVGVWKGSFSRQLMEQVKPTELHLVDIWSFRSDFESCIYGGVIAKGQEDMENIYRNVVAAFAEHPEVKIHRALSTEAAARIPDEHLDWVYIDGDHYYDGIKADLEAYYPKVKRGGIICGDDLKWTKPKLNGDKPVERAVMELVRDKGIKRMRIFGSQFLLYKP